MTVWHDIPGCAGYRATDDAQIFDVKRNRFKSQRRAGTGAMQVDIGKSTRMVHDLVARAFYGHPLVRGFRVKHLNGDPSDNRPENLVWAGRPVSGTQQPTFSQEFEQQYMKAQADRLALVELMQT